MKYKRVVLTGHGGTENLQLVEDEVPSPGPGQLLIRVHCAGVAFAEVMQRHGEYPGSPALPYTPGWDVVGTVQAAGENTRTKVGVRVAALTQFGGYAQYIVIEEHGAVEVPETIPDEKAVCLVLNYISAYQMLHRVAQLEPGDVVLVHGAAGGVGSAALQLCEPLGLSALGTASTEKQSLIRELGATAIDYQTQDFVEEVRRLHPSGVAAVLDPVSPANWKRSMSVLRRGGHLVAYGGVGLMNREEDRFLASTMSMVGAALWRKVTSLSKHFSFYGVSIKNPARTQEDLSAIVELCRLGKVEPLVSEVLPLARVGEAHEKLAAAQVRGKIVLDCS